MKINRPWWETDTYDDDLGIPLGIRERADLAGPEGLALVHAYEDGRTSSGWGGASFMHNYKKLKFAMPSAYVVNVDLLKPFAYIMRSTKMICVDIDGKNDGLKHVGKLGNLPKTLAEKSRSGNGYHLFYEVDDEWDDVEGFARFGDVIGIEQGVDIRGTGCVYHWPMQRWNHRKVAPIPAQLEERLLTRVKKKAAAQAQIVAIAAGDDEMEILMMHEDLIEELDKIDPPVGKRNNTLFAVASKLKVAGVPDWESRTIRKGADIGLSAPEVDKLVNNVQQYA